LLAALLLFRLADKNWFWYPLLQSLVE
jgi:hypothetical protein